MCRTRIFSKRWTRRPPASSTRVHGLTGIPGWGDIQHPPCRSGRSDNREVGRHYSVTDKQDQRDGKSTRSPSPARAWVRLPSGRRLDLLAPTPLDWTDEDLATGLARTFRWGGHSVWPDAPLSVAQHSLFVLALRRGQTWERLSPRQQLRELLHDADEGLINFDCISPLKPFLGPAFAALQARLAAVIAVRCQLPP